MRTLEQECQRKMDDETGVSSVITGVLMVVMMVAVLAAGDRKPSVTWDCRSVAESNTNR